MFCLCVLSTALQKKNFFLIKKVFKNLTSLLKVKNLRNLTTLKRWPTATTFSTSQLHKNAAAAYNESKIKIATYTTATSTTKFKTTDNFSTSSSSSSNSSLLYSPTNASHLSTLELSNNKSVILPLTSISPSPPPSGYLVWSEYCKMPNLNPYLPEVMKNFHREKYKPCKLISPLTQVEFNRTTQRYMLYVDQEVIPAFSKTGKLDCCYQSIVRNGTGAKADKEVR